MSIDEIVKEEQFLGIQVRVGRGNVRLLIGNVYGPNSEAEREVFLVSLRRGWTSGVVQCYWEGI